MAAIELMTAPEFAMFLFDGLFEGISVGGAMTSCYRQRGPDGYEAAWIVAEGEDRLGAMVACPTANMREGKDTGEAAARLAVFAPIREATPTDSFHIARLGILPAIRRRGFASALIDVAEAEAHRTGCCRLTLFVWADNAPAQALYAKHGFTRIDSLEIEDRPRLSRHGTMLLLGKDLG